MYNMKIKPHPDGFRIVRWSVNKSFQQVITGRANIAGAGAIWCVPHLVFSNKTDKVAKFKLEWGLVIPGYIEYLADDFYNIEYKTMQDEVDKVQALILKSY